MRTEPLVLVIRKEQLTALGRIPRDEFEHSLQTHLTRFYPVECNLAGPDQVLKFIRYGIQRAMVHNYETQRDAGMYINLMLMFGCDFDRDQQYPWAAGQLNDTSIADPFPRIQRVFRTALNYLDKTSGTGNQALFRALEHMRRFDLTQIEGESGVQLENHLVDLIQQIYPEKYSTLSRTIWKQWLRQVADSAYDLGLRRPSGRVLYSGLALLLGVGVHHDPLYPWVGEVLTSASTSDENARAAGLHQAAISYLDQVLSKS